MVFCTESPLEFFFISKWKYWLYQTFSLIYLRVFSSFWSRFQYSKKLRLGVGYLERVPVSEALDINTVEFYELEESSALLDGCKMKSLVEKISGRSNAKAASLSLAFDVLATAFEKANILGNVGKLTCISRIHEHSCTTVVECNNFSVSDFTKKMNWGFCTYNLLIGKCFSDNYFLGVFCECDCVCCPRLPPLSTARECASVRVCVIV